MNFTHEEYQAYLKVKSVMGVETKYVEEARYKAPIVPYESTYSSLIGKRVIVRSRMAGVMYGTLEGINGQHVSLSQARMLFRWKNENGGASLNDTVVDGLKDNEYSKLSKFHPKIEMLEACSVLSVSEKAALSLDNIKPYSYNEE